MKRIILSILICLCMVCVLCACGKDNSTEDSADETVIDKSATSSYIGRWDTQDFYLQIDKGGTASYRPIETPDNGFYQMTWEIIDDVIALDYESSVLSTRVTLELNDDGNQLTQIGGSFVKFKTGNEKATFTKVE